MSKTHRFLVLVATAVLSSCSAKVLHIDYYAYPQLPELTSSKFLKKLAMSSPKLEAKAFYGNYGGPGNKAGKPVDAMDELFWLHDIAYLESYKYRQMRQADIDLIAGLEKVDSSKLTPGGELYRLRAIDYFSSPVSRVVGKPISVILGLKKKPIITPGFGSGSGK